MRQGELRVDGNGALEVGHGGSWAARKVGPPTGTIRFQSFQGRRSGILKRRGVRFDGGQRFADLLSELTGNLTEGIEYVFFLRCLRLFFSEDLPGAAVLCAQGQYILASEAGNRAIE